MLSPSSVSVMDVRGTGGDGRPRAMVSLLSFAILCCGIGASQRAFAADSISPRANRSPVDVVVSPGGEWLITVNQTSNSVSLIDLNRRAVVDEIQVGEYPTAATLGRDGQSVLVTCTYSGELVELSVADNRLREIKRIMLGFHPTGVAVSPDGRTAYVPLSANAQVACVDLAAAQVLRHIEVGRWPRYLDVTPDGKRLVVGTSGDRGVSVVDLETGKMTALVNRFKGLNVGHMRISQDGEHAYFPWMHYGENVPSPGNIRRGWVIGNRLGKIRIADPDERETLSLDKEGEAVGDAFGVSIAPDERHIVISCGGTHEVLVFRLTDLPYTKVGSSEHIPPELLKDRERFARIAVGGRPLGLRFAPDSRHVYVANYLENSCQVIDISSREVVASIPLGGEETPSLARQGEAIFYDARRSFDQWYSCHSCHYEGGTNSEIMDTLNDNSAYTYKTVLPLLRVHDTGPWTWHGRQGDLREAMRKSMINTMVGPKPSEEDVTAIVEFFSVKQAPPNPFHQPGAAFAEAALRGKKIFEGEKANCASCHSGSHFTDGKLHDVGLNNSQDRFPDFNTPSLLSVYSKVRLLHDGRSRSLTDLLRGPHSPHRVTGNGELTDQELQDLVEYLKTL